MLSSTNAALRGISVCAPKKMLVTGECMFDSATEAQLFVKKIGIKFRRVSGGHISSFNLCHAAANSLMKELGWAAADIGLLISVTQSPDYTVPGNSYLLHKSLSLPSHCMVLDLNGGCTAWVQAVQMALALVDGNNIKKAIVVSGETNILSNPKSKDSFLLMGDMGTATAIEGIGLALNYHFDTKVYGDKFNFIYAPESGAAYLKESLASGKIDSDDTLRYVHQILMSGEDIHSFISTDVASAIKDFIVKTETLRDYHFIHQPNLLHHQFILKKVGLSSDKCPTSIGEFGNVSSACIPLTIHQFYSNKGSLKDLDYLNCHAFGVGMSILQGRFPTNDFRLAPFIEID